MYISRIKAELFQPLIKQPRPCHLIYAAFTKHALLSSFFLFLNSESSENTAETLSHGYAIRKCLLKSRCADINVRILHFGRFRLKFKVLRTKISQLNERCVSPNRFYSVVLCFGANPFASVLNSARVVSLFLYLK